MAQKLQSFVLGECREDDPDNIMFHEVALPGHILLLILKVAVTLEACLYVIFIKDV